MRKLSKYFKGIMGRPAVNIKRDCYTMATTNGNDAEIVMYGEIVQERPRDWWTDEPVEGDFIALDEFMEDLKAVSDANTITLRINSIGGDAFAAIPIHNRLRELKAKKIAIIDGVALSGGSLIACACDTIKVNPSSLFMIHKCHGFIWGSFNADELRHIATENDAVDKAQAAVYHRKSGIDEAEILELMSNTTYLTGAEAVDKGFADELLDTEAPNIAASADTRTLYVNGRTLRMLNPLPDLPESIPTVTPEAKVSVDINHKQPATTGGNKGGNKPMAKTLEELRVENPELANQFLAEAQAVVSTAAEAKDASAVLAERKRIEDIDTISALYDEEMVREAKYGENSCTAQEMAFRAAQQAAQKGKTFVEDMKKDFNASGAGSVSAAHAEPEDDTPLTPEQRMAQGRADAKKIKEEEGPNHE